MEGCDEEEAICNVCRDGHWSSDNQIIICEGTCLKAVHMSCYGLTKVPDGSFICDQCQAERSNLVKPCKICGLKGNGMIKYEGPTAAHIVCVLACNQAYFKSITHLSGIVYKPSKAIQSKKTCIHCDKVSGFMLSCCAKGCTASFHPSCAAEKDQRMELRASIVPEDELPPVYCLTHEGQARTVARSDGFSEMDIFGLLDGIGVCGRELWLQRTDYRNRALERIRQSGPQSMEDYLLIPPSSRGKMPGASTYAKQFGANQNESQNEESEYRGLPPNIIGAASALLHSQYLLYLHERLMRCLAHLNGFLVDGISHDELLHQDPFQPPDFLFDSLPESVRASVGYAAYRSYDIVKEAEEANVGSVGSEGISSNPVLLSRFKAFLETLSGGLEASKTPLLAEVFGFSPKGFSSSVDSNSPDISSILQGLGNVSLPGSVRNAGQRYLRTIGRASTARIPALQHANVGLGAPALFGVPSMTLHTLPLYHEDWITTPLYRMLAPALSVAETGARSFVQSNPDILSSVVPPEHRFAAGHQRRIDEGSENYSKENKRRRVVTSSQSSYLSDGHNLSRRADHAAQDENLRSASFTLEVPSGPQYLMNVNGFSDVRPSYAVPGSLPFSDVVVPTALAMYGSNQQCEPTAEVKDVHFAESFKQSVELSQKPDAPSENIETNSFKKEEDIDISEQSSRVEVARSLDEKTADGSVVNGNTTVGLGQKLFNALVEQGGGPQLGNLPQILPTVLVNRVNAAVSSPAYHSECTSAQIFEEIPARRVGGAFPRFRQSQRAIAPAVLVRFRPSDHSLSASSSSYFESEGKEINEEGDLEESPIYPMIFESLIGDEETALTHVAAAAAAEESIFGTFLDVNGCPLRQPTSTLPPSTAALGAKGRHLHNVTGLKDTMKAKPSTFSSQEMAEVTPLRNPAAVVAAVAPLHEVEKIPVPQSEIELQEASLSRALMHTAAYSRELLLTMAARFRVSLGPTVLALRQQIEGLHLLRLYVLIFGPCAVCGLQPDRQCGHRAVVLETLMWAALCAFQDANADPAAIDWTRVHLEDALGSFCGDVPLNDADVREAVPLLSSARMRSATNPLFAHMKANVSRAGSKTPGFPYPSGGIISSISSDPLPCSPLLEVPSPPNSAFNTTKTVLKGTALDRFQNACPDSHLLGTWEHWQHAWLDCLVRSLRIGGPDYPASPSLLSQLQALKGNEYLPSLFTAFSPSQTPRNGPMGAAGLLAPSSPTFQALIAFPSHMAPQVFVLVAACVRLQRLAESLRHCATTPSLASQLRHTGGLKQSDASAALLDGLDVFCVLKRINESGVKQQVFEHAKGLIPLVDATGLPSGLASLFEPSFERFPSIISSPRPIIDLFAMKTTRDDEKSTVSLPHCSVPLSFCGYMPERTGDIAPSFLDVQSSSYNLNSSSTPSFHNSVSQSQRPFQSRNFQMQTSAPSGDSVSTVSSRSRLSSSRQKPQQQSLYSHNFAHNDIASSNESSAFSDEGVHSMSYSTTTINPTPDRSYVDFKFSSRGGRGGARPGSGRKRRPELPASPESSSLAEASDLMKDKEHVGDGPEVKEVVSQEFSSLSARQASAPLPSPSTIPLLTNSITTPLPASDLTINGGGVIVSNRPQDPLLVKAVKVKSTSLFPAPFASPSKMKTLAQQGEATQKRLAPKSGRQTSSRKRISEGYFVEQDFTKIRLRRLGGFQFFEDGCTDKSISSSSKDDLISGSVSPKIKYGSYATVRWHNVPLSTPRPAPSFPPSSMLNTDVSVFFPPTVNLLHHAVGCSSVAVDILYRFLSSLMKPPAAETPLPSAGESPFQVTSSNFESKLSLPAFVKSCNFVHPPRDRFNIRDYLPGGTTPSERRRRRQQLQCDKSPQLSECLVEGRPAYSLDESTDTKYDSSSEKEICYGHESDVSLGSFDYASPAAVASSIPIPIALPDCFSERKQLSASVNLRLPQVSSLFSSTVPTPLVSSFQNSPVASGSPLNTLPSSPRIDLTSLSMSHLPRLHELGGLRGIDSLSVTPGADFITSSPLKDLNANTIDIDVGISIETAAERFSPIAADSTCPLNENCVDMKVIESVLPSTSDTTSISKRSSN